MAMRYMIEVVADTDDQAVLTEHHLCNLARLGIFTSAVSVADASTGHADEAERKYPLNVSLVRAYAESRMGE